MRQPQGYPDRYLLNSDPKAFSSTFDLTSRHAALGVTVSQIFIWAFSVCRHLGIYGSGQRHLEHTITGLMYFHHYL